MTEGPVLLTFSPHTRTHTLADQTGTERVRPAVDDFALTCPRYRMRSVRLLITQAPTSFRYLGLPEPRSELRQYRSRYRCTPCSDSSKCATARPPPLLSVVCSAALLWHLGCAFSATYCVRFSRPARSSPPSSSSPSLQKAGMRTNLGELPCCGEGTVLDGTFSDRLL
ncbi:hypothetical protein OH76DRAFT_1146727 [Lentinus brumalis]|uniref:Uncharacterized protein n=1 Tax=Lentinus brumalis TaxID=2498619 RepID=A0A371DMK7_9APHY|nr:hypothetical protein OH76DRAFT_1146727 [Polyporus brumalis]